MDFIGGYKRVDPRKEFIRTRRVLQSKKLDHDTPHNASIDPISDQQSSHSNAFSKQDQDQIDLHQDHQEISLFELQDLLNMLIAEETGLPQHKSVIAETDPETQTNLSHAIQAYQMQTEEFSSHDEIIDTRPVNQHDLDQEKRNHTHYDKSGFLALSLSEKQYYATKIDLLIAHGTEMLIVSPNKTYALAVTHALELIK